MSADEGEDYLGEGDGFEGKVGFDDVMRTGKIAGNSNISKIIPSIRDKYSGAKYLQAFDERGLDTAIKNVEDLIAENDPEIAIRHIETIFLALLFRIYMNGKASSKKRSFKTFYKIVEPEYSASGKETGTVHDLLRYIKLYTHEESDD